MMSTQVDPGVVRSIPRGHDATARSSLPTRSATRLNRLRADSARARKVLAPVWRDYRIATVVALATAAGWGLLAGWWTPRSPLTTGQAIWSIGISLLVGATAGVVMRSRWASVVACGGFAVVFEMTRMGTDGPTVDRPAFSEYGLYALLVGRGFHALISLAPIAFGAIVGAGLARLVGRPPDRPAPSRVWPQRVRRGFAIIAALGLVGFTFMLARPASTAAIVDSDGNAVPDSIAELTSVDINGHQQHLMIRGHNTGNPVLLFLAGGPGGSEMGAMRNHLSALEEHFTVVTWDQRGTGKSYDELDPTGTYTLDSVIDDTIAVTNYLRDRFGQDRILLLGQSWGSTLGVLAVQQHPTLFSAFIGTGQMVSQLATDTIFYNDTLDWARANGDTDLVAELTNIGPPPYDRMLSYETALSSEHDVYPYDHSANSEGEGGFSENFFVPEYALIDQIHLLGGFMDTFSVLYPQLQHLDFRRTATDFAIPMYFVQGAHEAGGRAEPFAEWYAMVDAPVKDLVVLATSGHRPLFEQPDEFVTYMVDTVLANSVGAS